MEKVFDTSALISVLAQGRDHTTDLKKRLHPTSEHDFGFLLENLLSSYDNALAMINGDLSKVNVDDMLGSLYSIKGSPNSEGSDPDLEDQGRKRLSKKRKTSEKWSEQVRVCSGAGSDGQLNDGYNWRKYGQKKILGANHPRAYYRCTHRPTQGCLATKQIQLTDEDPSTFEIIYKGKHTCLHEKLKKNKENPQVQNKGKEILTVEPNIAIANDEDFPLFSFPTQTPEQVEPQYFSPQFLSPTTSDSYFSLSPHERVESQFFSPQLLSPTTSDSYFSLSPFDFAQLISNPIQFTDSESDFSEIISNPNQFADFSSEEYMNFLDFSDATDGFL